MTLKQRNSFRLKFTTKLAPYLITVYCQRSISSMTAVDISCGIALHADMHMHSMQAAAAAMMVAESEMAVFPRGALLLREILIER